MVTTKCTNKKELIDSGKCKMAKWVWDIDERICVNVTSIMFFEILEHPPEYTLSAILTDKMSITIAESPDLGILKDKIRTIISGC